MNSLLKRSSVFMCLQLIFIEFFIIEDDRLIALIQPAMLLASAGYKGGQIINSIWEKYRET